MTAAANSGIALVTGASRGIGAAIAQRLTRDGFAMVANYASSSAEADKRVAEPARTGANADLLLDGKTAEPIAQCSAMPPPERPGQPDDIAGAVAFLAGPDGVWVNGQVLRANGGMA